MAKRTMAEIAGDLFDERVKPVAERLESALEDLRLLGGQVRSLDAMVKDLESAVRNLREAKPVAAPKAPEAPKAGSAPRVRLRVARKGGMVASEAVPREGGEVIAEPKRYNRGEVGSFDRENPSVILFARAGDLEAVDADGEAWLASLSD